MDMNFNIPSFLVTQVPISDKDIESCSNESEPLALCRMPTEAEQDKFAQMMLNISSEDVTKREQIEAIKVMLCNHVKSLSNLEGVRHED